MHAGMCLGTRIVLKEYGVHVWSLTARLPHSGSATHRPCWHLAAAAATRTTTSLICSHLPHASHHHPLADHVHSLTLTPIMTPLLACLACFM